MNRGGKIIRLAFVGLSAAFNRTMFIVTAINKSTNVLATTQNTIKSHALHSETFKRSYRALILIRDDWSFTGKIYTLTIEQNIDVRLLDYRSWAIFKMIVIVAPNTVKYTPKSKTIAVANSTLPKIGIWNSPKVCVKKGTL